MDLIMHNVKFGECIEIYSDNQEMLVIDCGTKNNKNIANNIAENIYKNKCYKIKNAMISHFDEDHISGFSYLVNKKYNNIFESFYIPYVTTYKDSDGNIQNILVEVAIYLYLFTKSKGITYHQSKALLEHIGIVTELCKNHSRIYALSENDKFRFGLKEFNVLWPERISKYKIIDEEVRSIITQIDRILTQNYPDVVELKKKIVDNMNEWFEIIRINEDRYTKIPIKEQSIKEIALRQKKYLEELNYYKLNIFYEEIESDGIFNLINILKYSITKTFFKDMNSTSIVFHNVELKCLFMGDVNKMGIKKISKNKYVLKRYKIIKLQHHATERYYSKFLPKAETYIISNGGFNRFKIGKSFNNLLSDKTCDIKCTNGINFCDIRDIYKGKCPKNCNQIGDITLSL